MLRFLIGVLVVSLATAAWAGIPDLDQSSAEVDAGALGASVFNLPNAQGAGFDEATLADGTVVDATINLELLDGGGMPIELYPFEDMWIATSGGGLVACPNGTSADQSTDEFGMTEWQNPMFAGGNSLGETVQVYIAGSPLNQPGIDLIFNSADISGDLVVNLADVTLFSGIFFAWDGGMGVYDYDGDFARDGAINLADVTLMSIGNGTACP